MFHGNAMFIGNSQKESSYFISSLVYRCRVDQTVKKIVAANLIVFAGKFFTEEIEDTESL